MSRVKDTDLMTTIEFAKALDRKIRDYNSRLHRGLRTTPLEAWLASDPSTEPASEQAVALALLRRDDATVVRAGVEFNGITYQGPGTAPHVGDRLQVGWLATRPDFVELFDPSLPEGENWLGRLEAVPAASNKLSGAIKQARTYQIETVERAERGARALRSEAAAQLRGGGVEIPGSVPVRGTGAKRPKSRKPTPAAGRTAAQRRARLIDAGIMKGTDA